MEKLDKESLHKLLNNQTTPAVTIYIPMHTTASPPHISENQIRFKNLVHKTAEKVRSQNSLLANQLERQVDALYNDLGFWEQQKPGLLLCATPDKIEMYHLPIDTEEYCAIDDTFHLAPLMGLLRDEHDFYVLSLAQHNPFLCVGTFYGLEDSDITLPKSPKEALNIDEPNQRTEHQGTSTAATGPSGSTGWFNGRGGARNPQEEDRLRFFRMIDKVICTRADRSLPMILTGIESELAEYRHISKYPYLLKGVIHGNHTKVSNHNRSLFESARDIVWQELVSPEHQAAVAEYERISGANPDRVAFDDNHLLEAAAQGRIDKLLAKMMRRTTDTLREKSAEVPRITFPKEPGESKRLNDIAFTVWRTSGTVYNLMPEEMPSGELMVARLRY
jgi:hypothetical protein